MLIKEETAELIYKKLQFYKEPKETKQTENNAKTPKNGFTLLKRSSSRNSVTEEEPTHSKFALIVLQLTYWGLKNSPKFVTLDDVCLVLSKITTEKNEVAAVLVEYLAQHELNKIIDNLLKLESKRAVGEDQLKTFMRGNTLLTAILAQQYRSLCFAQNLIDGYPDKVREYKREKKIPDDKIELEFALEGNKYADFLRTFLIALPIKLEKLPDFIKYNCYLIDKNLRSVQVEDKMILSFVVGYVFLRYINPSMITYVRSDTFKKKSQPLITEACINIVTNAITIPIQRLLNFVCEDKSEATSTDLRSKEVNEQKAGENSWILISYDIASPYKDTVKKALDRIVQPITFENPKPNTMPILNTLLKDQWQTILDFFEDSSNKRNQADNNAGINTSPNTTFFQPMPQTVIADPAEQLLETLKSNTPYDPNDNYQNLEAVRKHIERVEKLKAAQKNKGNMTTENKDDPNPEKTSLLSNKG